MIGRAVNTRSTLISPLNSQSCISGVVRLIWDTLNRVYGAYMYTSYVAYFSMPYKNKRRIAKDVYFYSGLNQFLSSP